MVNSGNLSDPIWPDRSDRWFFFNQMMKPTQERDVEVVEDFSTAKHLPLVPFDKKHHRNRTVGCHLTFKCPRKKEMAEEKDYPSADSCL